MNKPLERNVIFCIASCANQVQTGSVTRELMNEPMRSLRQSAANLIKNDHLHVELEALVTAGLTLVEDCIYFSEGLDANPHLSRKEMGALGHQSLVNKLHLEDYWETSISTGWDSWCVAQGVLLGRRVLVEAERLTPLPIDVVITVDEGGELPPYSDRSTVSFGPDSDETLPSSTFRFYVHRAGECWIDDDALGEKLDAIMIMRR